MFCEQNLSFKTESRSKFVFILKSQNSFFYVYVYNIFKPSFQEKNLKEFNLETNLNNSQLEISEIQNSFENYCVKYDFLEKILIKKIWIEFQENLENIPKKEKISYFLDSFKSSGYRDPTKEKQIVTLLPSNYGKQFFYLN